MSSIKEEPEEEPTGKRSKRGRRRFREISRINMTVRLLNGDKIHVEKMVRELKYKDPNFATESAAVRHYVHLGVIAETSTTDLRGSLTNNIVKRSQKEAVRAELIPLDNKVENLINAFKEFSEENSSLFRDVSRRTEVIETKLDAGNEAILGLLRSMNITGEQSFRNLIVLRSIIYVFFLGHKTGRIEPGKENLQKWHRMINLAHQKANALSVEEIKMLTGDVMETDVIRKMASEIFKEVIALPQPTNESSQQSQGSTLIL